MNARLGHLFILVSDLERTRRFYVDVLGLQLLMEHPGYIRVGAEDGFHMGIEEGATVDVDAVGIEIVIQVDDVDRRYQEMKAKGAGFVDPPADQPWGTRQAWLTDPDGYRLSIFTPLAPAQP